MKNKETGLQNLLFICSDLIFQFIHFVGILKAKQLYLIFFCLNDEKLAGQKIFLLPFIVAYFFKFASCFLQVIVLRLIIVHACKLLYILPFLECYMLFYLSCIGSCIVFTLLAF